jgi:hypothetical protein
VRLERLHQRHDVCHARHKHEQVAGLLPRHLGVYPLQQPQVGPRVDALLLLPLAPALPAPFAAALGAAPPRAAAPPAGL